MDGMVSNPQHPGLGIGQSLVEALSGGHGVIIQFKGTRFNVDRDDFALIARFDLLPNARFIEFLPTLGHLFFAVTSLADWHSLDLITTILLFLL
jgi:hypothetical protein